MRSAAVWTYHARVACVLSVTEKGRPLASDEEGGGGGGSSNTTPMSSDGGSSSNGGGNGGAKLARLRELLGEMVGAPQGLGICSIERAVRGDVRHDRRLHRLMLEEEAAAWARGEPLGRAAGGGEDEGEVEGEEEESREAPSVVPTMVKGKSLFEDSPEASQQPQRLKGASPTDSASSMEAPAAAAGGAGTSISAPPVATWGLRCRDHDDVDLDARLASSFAQPRSLLFGGPVPGAAPEAAPGASRPGPEDGILGRHDPVSFLFFLLLLRRPFFPEVFFFRSCFFFPATSQKKKSPRN